MPRKQRTVKNKNETSCKRTKAEEENPMLVAAKDYALGRGTERDVERAKQLISEAAEKGDENAKKVVQVMTDCNGQKKFECSCLSTTK